MCIRDRFRADKAPEIESIIVEKPGVDVAYGAIGIGEITSIPTAPAIAGAYYCLLYTSSGTADGLFRGAL